jgi:hypothetical protein
MTKKSKKRKKKNHISSTWKDALTYIGRQITTKVDGITEITKCIGVDCKPSVKHDRGTYLVLRLQPKSREVHRNQFAYVSFLASETWTAQ